MDMAVRRISKVLIAGPVGVGKTTAVAAVSDSPIVTTEARPTDDTRLLKETTTVALDFGVLQLEGNHAIHLYGMPGQQRFDFMWEILAEGGTGVIVLLDASQQNVLEDLQLYIDAFMPLVSQGRLAIGVTRMTSNSANSLQSCLEYLDQLSITAPVFEADPRSRRDIVLLIQALLAAVRSTS